MTTTLLKTKLYIPPLRPSLVARHRLMQQLNAAGHAKLILISAPAGFGKTTLVTGWLRQRAEPAAWLSLDKHDNELSRFLRYLIAAIQTTVPGFGQSLATALATSQQPDEEALHYAFLEALIELDQPLVMVLDDYQMIDEPAIHNFLAFTLDYIPQQFQLIITSREEPPLPLPKWRARGQLLEIGAAGLRFTKDEAAEFLSKTMGLQLNDLAVNQLETTTEGWVAGLQLAALSLQRSEDPGALIHSFAGSDRLVTDYLLSEVLLQQTADIQQFLLKTSILEQFNASLCDHLLNMKDSQQILELLEQSNLFLIPLDNRRYWYRYHHLFAQLLQDRLQKGFDPSSLSTLHEEAARWYEAHDLLEAAVPHALHAQNFAYAAQLIASFQVHTLWEQHGSRLTQEWVSALPDNAIRRFPRSAILAAAAYLITGDIQQTRRYLSVTGEDPSIQAERKILLGIVARNQGDFQLARQLCQEGLASLPEGETTIRAMAQMQLAVNDLQCGHLDEAEKRMWSVQQHASPADLNTHYYAIWFLGNIFTLRGDPFQAANILHEGLERIQQQDGSLTPLVGLVYTALGRIHYLWNDQDQAERYFLDALDWGRRSGISDILFDSYRGISDLALRSADHATALEMMNLLQKQARESRMPDVIAMAESILALYHLRMGLLEDAVRWVNASGASLDDEPAFHQFSYYQIAALIRLAEYRHHGNTSALLRLLALLDRLLDPLINRGYNLQAVECLVLRALALDQNGETGGALSSLHQALSLARPGSLVSVFLDAGPQLLPLLARVSGRYQPYAASIMQAFPSRPNLAGSQPVPPLPEPLTEREQEVLQLITAGLSNREIQEKLTISKNTVRTHIKNIYGKLGVHSRTQAIHRARELALF